MFFLLSDLRRTRFVDIDLEVRSSVLFNSSVLTFIQMKMLISHVHLLWWLLFERHTLPQEVIISPFVQRGK